MALVLNTDLSSGLTVAGSYARINSVGGNKNGAAIELKFYVSQTVYQEGRDPVKTEYFHFVPSVTDGAVEWIKQGYDYLKTLPEFVGAVDA